MASSNQYLVEVYSTLGCKHCKKAKATLSGLGLVDFSAFDIKVDGKAALQIERVEYTRATTVPQIYVGNEHIGGCDDLLTKIYSGEFAAILERNAVKLGEPIAVVDNAEQIDIRLAEREVLTNEQIVEKYKSYVMNDHDSKIGEIIEASAEQILHISVELQTLALQLVDKFMNADGSRVRYGAMRQSPELQAYVVLCSTLQRYRLEDFSTSPENVRMSFFSNLYNSMIVHANCVLGPAEDTPSSRSLFFSGKGGNKYNICGQIFCPDDIEHGILRGNSRHPSQPEDARSFWPPEDPRGVLALSSLDPRVHFILNCGASSCPPIKVLGFEPEEALKVAASSYLQAETAFTSATDSNKAIIQLPKLLLWYGADFGRNSFEQVSRVCSLMGTTSLSQSISDALLTSSDNELSFDLTYGNYNWAINEEKE